MILSFYHSFFKTSVGLFVCGHVRAISSIHSAISKIYKAISKISKSISKKHTLVLETRQCNFYVATCTSQQLQDCKFTIVVFNVLVSGKYGDKTVFQEPCVLQTKFGIFLVDVVRNRSNSKDQKTAPCISIAMGAMSKEEPPKKRCSKLCGSFWFVFLFCFRFSCLCFSVAGAAKIYEHM